MMQSYWFGDVIDGECRPFHGNITELADRILEIQTNPEEYVPPDWRFAVECRVCRDRNDYVRTLREVCILLAERRIVEEYRRGDAALLQMVRTLDEMDNVINLLTGRVIDWHQVTRPGYSQKYRRTPPRILVRTISQKSRGPLARISADIEHLSETRTALAGDVSNMAIKIMPNCSALLGGLVAARLMYHAGGLLRLSRLPGSAIQVLGARTALFSHLRGKTPPPKHGIIFQHRRVHNAPSDVRGKVARVLAAKLAIAARLDLYRGEPVPEFLETAQARIDSAGIR